MAQERKKRRIVLASILKPVDDTRMFEKMGASLAQSGEYEVFIIGYPTSSTTPTSAVQFISLPPFKRLSFQRLIARWKVFKKVMSLKPAILIFNTHELLLPAVFLKVLINTSIVYDVRENHYRNILLSGSFPWLIRWPLALQVRSKEKLLAPSIDHFFLAEHAYQNEFKFHRSGWTVLENKAPSWDILPRSDRGKISSEIKLLFSGTLAESTGVFHAITVAKELHQLDSTIALTIIGHAALKTELEKILSEISSHPYIHLIGGDKLIPHPAILDAIQHSDFGIISYPDSLHTANAHPTKLFEYLSARLPIILDQHWAWTESYLDCEPFAFIDFTRPDYQSLLHELKTKKFYTKTPEEVTWKSEEPKLLQSLKNL